MNKTRFLMFSMVLLLSLSLAGMAMAADSLPQIENPPVDEDSVLDTTSDTANDIPTPPAIAPDPDVSEVEAELQAESAYPRLASPSSAQMAPVILIDEVIYYSDFEADNGGMIPSLDWTWGLFAWNGASCDSDNYPPPTALSGTHMWGTRLNDCYQNLGNNSGYGTCSNTNPADDSILTLSIDLTNYGNASLSWWEWYDLFSQWDWAEVYANGTPILQHCEPSFVQPTAWVQQVIDLTPYAGGMLTLEFHMLASSVINHAGWFIDDLTITGTPLVDIIVTPLQLEADVLPDQTKSRTSTIYNMGTADLIWNLTDSNSGWLSENPSNGTIPPGGSTLVTVIFDSTGKPEGLYTATIDISSNDPDQPLITLPVEMNVTSGLWTQIPLPATCPDWYRFDGEFFPETGLVYLMGGRAGSDFIDTIYSFDPTAETCADTGQIMPIPIANYSIVLVNNGTSDLLCTMGGYTEAGVATSAVQCYDPIENSVATISFLPAAYGAFNPGGVAVVNNKVYIFGGFRNDVPPYNSVQTWEWDPITNVWVQMGDISLGRGYINAAVVDGLIYAMGGDTFDGYSLYAQQTTEVFNPALGTWDDAAVSDLPDATGEGRAYGFDSYSPYSLSGKILIAGGGQWSSRTNDVFTYDVASDTYDYLFADLNVPRRDHAGFFIPDEDGVLWVLGGYSDSDVAPFGPPEYYIVGQPPDIEVTPLSMHATQPPDNVTTQPITICNTGETPLLWAVTELYETIPGNRVLFDNGPLVTHPGGGYNGADASAVQTAIGMLSRGYNNLYGTYRITDDFEVSNPDGWYIQQFKIFAYQGLAPVSPSPITGIYYQIWDGPPDDLTSSIVFGNLSTNRLVSSEFSNIYRVYDTDLLNPDRGVFSNVASAGVELSQGTYWLDWTTAGSISYTGPWVSPITILGQTTTGNAMQWTGVWNAVLDEGITTPQGIPFVIEGSLIDIPWLSETPTSGTIPVAGCQPIDVIFDSTGLAPATYTGTLNIRSNDPDEPIVTLPVTLTVGFPDIEVTPLSLEMTLNPNESGTLTVTIGNVGIADLTWNLSDSATWLSEDPTSGTTLASGTNEVVVTFDATGMAPGTHSATLVTTSNDPDEPSVSIPVTLIVKNYPFYLPVIARH